MFKSLCLFLSFGFCTVASLCAQELSPEGVLRASAHRFLVEEFIAGRDATITGTKTVTEDERILQELVVLKTEREFDSRVVMELPQGAERVAGMFRHLTLRGEGLLRITSIRLLPFAAESHLHQSKSEDAFYRVQMPSMPVPRTDLETIRLEIHCSGEGRTRVDTVEFHSQGKLRMVFDDIPFRNLGVERPRRRVTVDIDSNSELNIGGTTALQPHRWFRYYALPGMVPRGLERWAHDRGFAPGRQILKLHPALVKGYSKNQPKLVEDPDRPGYADLSFFDRYQAGHGLARAIQPFRSIPFATCFDEWPAFMSCHPGGRGTPKIEHFDAAAELAAAFIENQIKAVGRTATWWEVKNESTIKAEWDYHYNKDVDAWELLADFHNRVATQVKRRSPEVQVGGPTSAWMQVQVGDFGLYRSQQRFMDLTADALDFYSHHFYEDFGTIGAYERRSTKYTNYLLGRFEAILDMLHAHMDGTNNTKPILITECGSLQPGRSPSDDWLRLRSFSAYLTKAMQRPDQIGMIVPFIFLNIPWNPTSGDAAFEPISLDPDGTAQVPGQPIQGYRRRHVSRFFDLWRGFDGNRLFVEHDEDFLDVVAVHQQNTVMIAATNMGGDRLTLDLKSFFAGANVRHASQRRLYYFNGRIRYEELPSTTATSFPIDVEETSVLVLTLQSPLKPTQVVRQQRLYSGDTAVKSDGDSAHVFRIKVPDLGGVSSAKLVVGVHHNGSAPDRLFITVNGRSTAISKHWFAEFKDLFTPATVHIPVAWLTEDNHIRISPIPGATVTSVHLLVNARE